MLNMGFPGQVDPTFKEIPRQSFPGHDTLAAEQFAAESVSAKSHNEHELERINSNSS